MFDNEKENIEKIYEKITMLAPLKDSFVAYLDLLGFKNLVEKNTSKELERIYNMIYSIHLVNVSAKDMKTGEIYGVKIGSADTSNALVNSLFVSDCIILWTDNTDLLSFMKMIITVKKCLISGFLFGFPIRGAIVKGSIGYHNMIEKSDMIVNGQLIYGLGLIKAVKLEEKQCWSGCIIDAACIDYYKQIVKNSGYEKVANTDALVKNKGIIKCSIPLKEENIESYAINWTNEIHINEKKIVESFNKYNKSTKSKKVKKIIDNTLSFYKNTKKILA